MPAVRVAPRSRASRSSSISRSASLMRALGLGGARLGAAPQPLDLAPDGVGERLLVGGLAAQELVAPDRGTRCSAPSVCEQPLGVGAVDLEHARWPRARGSSGRGSPRGTRAARSVEERLEPEDAVDVEVVGRLVHQEDVGLGGELAGDGQPLAASRRRARSTSARPSAKPRPAQGVRDARRADRPRRPPSMPRPATSSTVPPGREHGILRHVADANAPAQRAACRESGDSRPARILRRVDLPEPFGPTRPTWSPSKSPKDSPSKRDRVP